MTKQLQAFLSFIILIAAVFWSFYGTHPHPNLEDHRLPEEFSVARAMEHVEALAEEPHYVGSPAHSRARNYIVSQLEEMGLLVQTQEAYSLNKKGVITRPQNIISHIEGSGDGKALLLLTHYDSAMHSSYGASDAASGVGTILEGLRAYLASGAEPVNDIIIVFTDGEELGLSGADIFVEEHPWAKDVGIALNFEARGSGGNSFMFLETNGGNKKLLQEFIAANVAYPVTNSLAYSIYKLLPNDTDLTVLREQANINGFNFAFIDDHFDYHTANDIPENLDLGSLAQQGNYLLPLLEYFSSKPLENLSSKDNLVFFSFPVVKMLSYPYSWIFPMLLIAVLLFVMLLFYAGFKKRIPFVKVLKGFLPLLISLLLSGLLVYGLWQFLLFIYPEYAEMEHGFTYNGYDYIAAAIFLSLAVCFYTYARFRKPKNGEHLYIAPLFLWLVLCVLLAFYLKGGAYFIIPFFFGMLQLLILIQRPKYGLLLVTLLALPAIFILTPLIVTFVVALGLKMLVLAALLSVLLWVLLWPVFSCYTKNQLLGFLSFITFMVFLLLAHFKSDFSTERPKPNSLVYLMDEEAQTASWNTYDEMPDEWTAPYFPDSLTVAEKQTNFSSKYGTGFTKTAPAPAIMLPSPYIKVEKAAAISPEEDAYRVLIAPNRSINRIELFTNRDTGFKSFSVNGKTAPDLQPGRSDLHIFKHRWSDRSLTYYPVNRDTLRLEMSIEKGVHPEITLYESAYDLLENAQLKVPPRKETMIPRPFVLNDATVIKDTFVLK